MPKAPIYIPVLERDLKDLIRQIDTVSKEMVRERTTDKGRNGIRKLRLFKFKYSKKL